MTPSTPSTPSTPLTGGGLTTVLAELAARLTVENLPEDVRHNARRTLANAVALAAGAAGHPAVAIVRAGMSVAGGSPIATMLGTPWRGPGRVAALHNGVAAHVEDFDDTHLETVVHPGAPIVPAALAMAEITGASGATLLAGIAAGVEVALRVGLALGPGHFDRGWHLTGTAGHVGAAAGAARVAGLDPVATRSALAIAAGEAAGLQEALGTMVKSLHAGKAAADGLEAALMAAVGIAGPASALEGRRGLLALASPAPDVERALSGLGSTWELGRNAFKPYACGIVSHPVIDAAIALGAQLERDPIQVDSATVTVNPVVLDVMGVADPQTGLQAKFSAAHCFAAGFVVGAGGPDEFSDALATDPGLRALRQRVHFVLDPSVRRDECRATVNGPGGHLEHHVVHATGSEQSPVTDDQLATKAVQVARGVLGEDQARRLFDLAMHVDTLADVSPLVAAAVPRSPAAPR